MNVSFHLKTFLFRQNNWKNTVPPKQEVFFHIISSIIYIALAVSESVKHKSRWAYFSLEMQVVLLKTAIPRLSFSPICLEYRGQKGWEKHNFGYKCFLLYFTQNGKKKKSIVYKLSDEKPRGKVPANLSCD